MQIKKVRLHIHLRVKIFSIRNSRCTQMINRNHTKMARGGLPPIMMANTHNFSRFSTEGGTWFSQN